MNVKFDCDQVYHIDHNDHDCDHIDHNISQIFTSSKELSYKIKESNACANNKIGNNAVLSLALAQ